jgi:hypothetical protein
VGEGGTVNEEKRTCAYVFGPQHVQYGYADGEVCGMTDAEDELGVCHDEDCPLRLTMDWHGTDRYLCGCHGHQFVGERTDADR